VRIIAATNADVETAVREGKLRQDLYYPLNILPLVLPLLRQRREDISLLARHFLHKYAAEFDKPVSLATQSLVPVSSRTSGTPISLAAASSTHIMSGTEESVARWEQRGQQ
jgi:transcriptional regulator with GAF, ATPase, and Fis domain